MKPFFTIIIPTLNEEAYICSLLLDIKKQTFTEFEVIVVDGISEDKTKKVVEGYKSSFPLQFRAVKKRNVSYQRNTGAELARGSYLIFLDADVRIRRTFLQKLYMHIQKQKGLLFIPEIFPDIRDPQTQIVFDGVNAAIRISQTLGKPFSSGGSMIIERNFFRRIGMFSEKAFMSEDHQLVQEAYKYGVHAKFSPDIKVSFSLRRFNKEGKFKVLYKYVVNTIHFLSEGKVDKKIFEYEMGGHIYKKGKKKAFALDDIVKLPIKQLRTIFYGLFRE